MTPTGCFDRCAGHFPPLQGIRPKIETVPLANAAEAYGRMMRNEARFRIVLVTGHHNANAFRGFARQPADLANAASMV